MSSFWVWLFGNDAQTPPRSVRPASIAHRKAALRGGILEDLEEFSSPYRFACSQIVRFEREPMTNQAA